MPSTPPAARRKRTLLAASLLALFAALLAPITTAGAAQGPPGAPGTISGAWDTTTDTTLNLSWTSPGGTYLEYDVKYQADNGTVWSASTACPSSGWSDGPTGRRTASASITGLTKTSTYVVAVRARDRETGLYGSWACSGLIEPAGTPDVVLGISERARTASVASLSLRWEKVSGAAGGYDVRVSENTATKSWATTATEAQPTTGDYVDPRLTGTNLPSGFAISKTYVVQVRSKSATGTCGTGTVVCSRWVQSDALAQLDISGLDVEYVTPSSVPYYMTNIGYHLKATWDALPSAVSSPTYQVRFNYRSGNPNTHYDTTDTNTDTDALPDNWLQDWQWHFACKTPGVTNPARGCNQPCDPSWNIVCNLSNAYGTYPPLWRFDQGAPVWGAWVNVASSTCDTATSTCSHTFNYAADENQTVAVEVRAVSGSTTGPVTAYRSSAKSTPKAPRNLMVCAPSGASVRVEWQRGFRGSAPITGYHLSLHKKPTSLLSSSITTVESTPGTEVTADDPRRCDKASNSTRYTGNHPQDPVRSYTWHGVDTSRSYYVTISGVNRYGRGRGTASGTIALTATAPPAPAPPTFGTITASSVVVNWTAPADDGGNTVNGYDVQYRACDSNCSTSSPTWGAWVEVDVTGSPLPITKTVTGLSADTKHEFAVRAENSTGDGAWSVSAEATTIASN